MWVAISESATMDVSKIGPTMGSAAGGEQLAQISKATTTKLGGKAPSTSRGIQAVSKKVQRMANKMFKALKKKKGLLRNPDKLASKSAEEKVSKLSEQVQALLKTVRATLGKKGKANNDALARLEGAIKNMDWHMQRDLGRKAGSITLQEMRKYSKLLEAARKASLQSRVGVKQMAKIESTAAGVMNIIRAGANTLKVLRAAQRSSARTNRRDLSANRADTKAAGSSLQAAEAAASTVGVGKTKRSAKRAAQIAAGAIESSKVLDAATRRSARVSAAVGSVTTSTFRALASEGRAFAKAADETNQILGKAQKQEQKAVVAESKAEKDGSKAEQMVMKVVNAQSKDGARAAEAVAKAEILAAKVQTAQMQRNGLKGLKAMTKSILQTEKGVLKSLRTSLKAVKRPLKELKRGKRRLEKDLKTTSSGGVARSVISAENAVQRMKSAKSKQKARAATKASAKASAALVKVSEKAKIAEEAIAAASAKMAGKFSKSVTTHLKREVKEVKAAMRNLAKIDQQAKAIKLVTKNDNAKSINFVRRKTNSVMRKAVGNLKSMLGRFIVNDNKFASSAAAHVADARRVAQRLANKDRRSHARVKQIQKVANAAAKTLQKKNNKARNALRSEERAAKAAKADGQKRVARIYRRSEKIAKKELKKSRTASKDTASAKATVSAIRNAIKYGGDVSVNGLQAVVDAMRSADISARSVAMGFRIAQNADKNPADVTRAGKVTRADTKALKATSKGAVQSFIQRQKARAVAAAEKAAAAVLAGGRKKQMKKVAHKVVLAAVRSEDAKTNAGEIFKAVKAAGVPLTPAAISAALHSAKMPIYKIARSLSKMGVSAASICNSLSRLGGNANAAKIAKQMSRAGFSARDIVSGLAEAGLASEKNLGRVMRSAGLNVSARGIKRAIASQSGLNPGHKIITNSDKIHTRTGLPKGAASTLASLHRAGIPVTPLNVAKALKKSGMNTLDVLKTLAAVGVKVKIGAAAMKQAGFHAAVVDGAARKISSSSKAINAATLNLVDRMSSSAADVIRSMIAKKIPLSRDNLRNALTGEGVKSWKVRKIVNLVAPRRYLARAKTAVKKMVKKVSK
jgi:hypothetical protein